MCHTTPRLSEREGSVKKQIKQPRSARSTLSYVFLSLLMDRAASIDAPIIELLWYFVCGHGPVFLGSAVFDKPFDI